MSRRDKLNSLIDCPKETLQQLHGMLDIFEASATNKTEREKTLEKMVSVAKTDAERKQFQELLNKEKSEKTVDIGDIIQEVEDLNQDPVDIMRAGLSKKINSIAYPYTPAAKKREQENS